MQVLVNIVLITLSCGNLATFCSYPGGDRQLANGFSSQSLESFAGAGIPGSVVDCRPVGEHPSSPKNFQPSVKDCVVDLIQSLERAGAGGLSDESGRLYTSEGILRRLGDMSEEDVIKAMGLDVSEDAALSEITSIDELPDESLFVPQVVSAEEPSGLSLQKDLIKSETQYRLEGAQVRNALVKKLQDAGISFYMVPQTGGQTTEEFSVNVVETVSPEATQAVVSSCKDLGRAKEVAKKTTPKALPQKKVDQGLSPELQRLIDEVDGPQKKKKTSSKRIGKKNKGRKRRKKRRRKKRTSGQPVKIAVASGPGVVPVKDSTLLSAGEKKAIEMEMRRRVRAVFEQKRLLQEQAGFAKERSIQEDDLFDHEVQAHKRAQDLLLERELKTINLTLVKEQDDLSLAQFQQEGAGLLFKQLVKSLPIEVVFPIKSFKKYYCGQSLDSIARGYSYIIEEHYDAVYKHIRRHFLRRFKPGMSWSLAMDLYRDCADCARGISVDPSYSLPEFPDSCSVGENSPVFGPLTSKDCISDKVARQIFQLTN